jgi:hypothetical protein
VGLARAQLSCTNGRKDRAALEWEQWLWVKRMLERTSVHCPSWSDTAQAVGLTARVDTPRTRVVEAPAGPR